MSIEVNALDTLEKLRANLAQLEAVASASTEWEKFYQDAKKRAEQ
jgi:hypothetical protein